MLFYCNIFPILRTLCIGRLWFTPLYEIVILIYSSLEAIMNVDDGIFLVWKTAAASETLWSSWWRRRRKSGPWNESGKNFVCQTFLKEEESGVLVTSSWGIGGKLCHKCPLSNYDNLTLAKWWWMKKTDEETRQEDCTYLLSSDGLVNRIWLFGSWNFPFFPQFGDIFWQFFKMEHNGGIH